MNRTTTTETVQPDIDSEDKLLAESVGHWQTPTGIESSVLIAHTAMKSTLPENAARLICMVERWHVTLKKLKTKTEL